MYNNMETMGVMIRKVKTLKGRARDKATEMNLNDNDLVILRTSAPHPLPEYTLQKIDGDPLAFLQKLLLTDDSRVHVVEEEEK